jgi:GntR family transcriptional regulator
MSSRTALPVHQQLSEMLIREIAAGRMLDGEKLPPEREMAVQYGVAVGTLRKALAELTRQGMLERVQGSGNYVRARSEAAGVYAMFRLELAGGGGLPTAIVLDVQRMAKPRDLPPFGSSGEAHRIRRLRSLGATPAAVEEIWLDGSRAPAITAADLSESLYLHYRKALGFWIARAEDRIGVGEVPSWAPPGLGLAPRAACGFVERIGYAQDGASAEYSRTWFNHTIARYVSRLK